MLNFAGIVVLYLENVFLAMFFIGMKSFAFFTFATLSFLCGFTAMGQTVTCPVDIRVELSRVLSPQGFQNESIVFSGDYVASAYSAAKAGIKEFRTGREMTLSSAVNRYNILDSWYVDSYDFDRETMEVISCRRRVSNWRKGIELFMESGYDFTGDSLSVYTVAITDGNGTEYPLEIASGIFDVSDGSDYREILRSGAIYAAAFRAAVKAGLGFGDSGLECAAGPASLAKTWSIRKKYNESRFFSSELREKRYTARAVFDMSCGIPGNAVRQTSNIEVYGFAADNKPVIAKILTVNNDEGGTIFYQEFMFDGDKLSFFLNDNDEKLGDIWYSCRKLGYLSEGKMINYSVTIMDYDKEIVTREDNMSLYKALESGDDKWDTADKAVSYASSIRSLFGSFMDINRN